MTPEQLQALQDSISASMRSVVTTIVAEAVAPLSAEIAALKTAQRAAPPVPAAPAAPAPAPEKPPENEIEALRATILRLSARRATVGTEDVVIAGPGATASIRSMVAECRAHNVGVGLAALVERHVELLAEEDGPSFTDKPVARGSLVDVLAAGLRLAEADGILVAPGDSIGW